MPGRIGISWADEKTLKLETERMEGTPAQEIRTAEMKAQTSRTSLGNSDPSDPKSPVAKRSKNRGGK